MNWTFERALCLAAALSAPMILATIAPEFSIAAGIGMALTAFGCLLCILGEKDEAESL